MQLVALAVVGISLLATAKLAGSLGQQPRLAPPYWGWLAVVGSEVESYDSLRSMTAAADVVVVGHIADIREGRSFGSETDGFVYYPQATLKVDRVLAGSPLAGDETELLLEFATLEPPEMGVLRASLIDISGVFFLRNKGVSAAMAGQPEGRQAIEADYYRVLCSNGWLLPQGDRMVLPLAWEDSALVAELSGRKPTDVIDTIEALEK
jgi:hypothetical protein